jgi:hypothetical protein
MHQVGLLSTKKLTFRPMKGKEQFSTQKAVKDPQNIITIMSISRI